MTTKPSERAVAGVFPSDDVIDTMLILHGTNASLHPVPFHRVERGDRLIFADLAGAITAGGPCADVALTSGAQGHITTSNGLQVTMTATTENVEPYLWVVELGS